MNEHLSQTEQLTSKRPKVAIVDRGYKGKKEVGSTEIISPKPLGKNATAYQKRKMRRYFRRRAAIEPVIGHMKKTYRMKRNYLKGVQGDVINAVMAGGYNNLSSRLLQLVCFHLCR